MCCHYNNRTVNFSNFLMVFLHFEPWTSQSIIRLKELGHGLSDSVHLIQWLQFLSSIPILLSHPSPSVLGASLV